MNYGTRTFSGSAAQRLSGSAAQRYFVLKDVLFSYLLVVVVSLSSIGTVNATPAYCYPDCFNDLWIFPSPDTVYFVDGDCVYYVKFGYRVACPGQSERYDYLVTHIYTFDENCPQRTIHELMAMGIHALINRNPAGFPEPYFPQDPCQENWRISKNVCWGEGTPWLPGMKKVYVPCESVSLCCLIRYRVCRLFDGTLTSDRIGCLIYNPLGEPTSCPPVCEQSCCY